MALRRRRGGDDPRQALWRDGYVLLPGDDTSRSAAAAIAPALEEDARRLAPFEEEFRVYAPGHVRQYAPADHPAVADIAALPAVRRLADATFGAWYVYDLVGHTILPGAVSQPVHADWGPLWPGRRDDSPPFMLGVNVAVQATDETNGCLEVWPKTHVGARQDDFAAGSLAVRDPVGASAARRAPPVRVPMAPGDVLVRDVRLWHRGMPNHGAGPRPMVWILVAAWWFRPGGELRVTDRVRERFRALGVDVDCRVADGNGNHLRLPAAARGEG